MHRGASTPRAGLLESTYDACLAFELQLRGLFFQQQCTIPVRYKGHELECGYRAHFIVASRIVIELKSVDRLSPVHEAQLLTYLKLSGLPVGLLVNFNVPILKQGLRRLTR